MEQQDRKFESFLRGFEPRRPRALPTPISSRRPAWVHRLAAAAVVFLAAGFSFWALSRNPPASNEKRNLSAVVAPKTNTVRLSSTMLTQLALEDVAKLNALLDESPQSQPPRFDQANSALATLATEGRIGVGQ